MSLIKPYFKLQYLAIFCFSIFFLIPNRIKGFPVIFLFIISILVYFKEKKITYPIKKVLWFSSIYIVLIISLMYTNNFENVDKLLTTCLSLLIVPVSFGFLKSTQRNLQANFLLKFQILLFITTTIYSIWILIYLNNLGVFVDKMSFYDAISYITNEMKPINQHPIYGSIFISISLIFTVYFWFSERNKKFVFYTIPFLLIQILTLLMLDRKGVLLALLVGLVSIIVFFLKKQTSKIVKTSIILSVILLTTLVFTSNRFKELYNKSNYSLETKFNSTSLRFNIYYCVFEKIKESPVIGFGLGDVQKELNKCYKDRSHLLTEITYNSHNQYLSYFLSSGFIGFLLMVSLMISIIFSAIKKHNIILLSLAIFFSISMLFENILERQSGVILFSFYLCLFSFYNFSEKKSITL